MTTELDSKFVQQCQAILSEAYEGVLSFEAASARFVGLVQPPTPNDLQGYAYLCWAQLSTDHQRLTTALEQLDRAYLHLEKQPKLLILVDLQSGEVFRRMGDYTRARRQFASAQASANQLSENDLALEGRVKESLMLLHQGSFEQVNQILETSLQRIRARWDGSLEQMAALLCDIHRGLALTCLHEDKAMNAWAQAQQAYRTALNSQMAAPLGYAYRVLGEVLGALPTPPFVPEGFHTDGDLYFRQAIEQFQAAHLPNEVAHTLYRHAKYLHRTGQPASRRLGQAIKMFTQLEMKHDLALATELQSQVL